MTRHWSLILSKTHGCKMKISTVPVHGFVEPKLNWHQTKLERIFCTPEKTVNSQKEGIDVAQDITFACSDIARQNLGSALMKNYVHAGKTFRLGCSGFPLNTVTIS